MKKIKVAFFGEDFSRKAKGTALVIQKLTEQLLAHFSNQVEITLIRKQGPCDHPLAKKVRNIEIKIYGLPVFATLISYAIFFITNRESFDVIVFNKFVYPGFWFLNSKKFILLAYDAPENPIYKEKLIFTARLFYWFLGLAGKHFFDAIVAVSEDAKRAVADYHGWSSDKIFVVYPAAAEIFQKYSGEEKEKSKKILESKYGITQPFILDVSRIEPHKNIHTLVDAFSLLKSRRSIPHKLVIVGGRHFPEYSSMIDEKIKKENLSRDIIIAPYIEDEDMPRVYNLADLLVFPSLLEGFGLPLVEAMRCGVPIITSDIPALAEVAGDAAILVNPRDSRELAEKIGEALNNPDLRADLVSRGLKRSQSFSWLTTADQFLKILKM